MRLRASLESRAARAAVSALLLLTLGTGGAFADAWWRDEPGIAAVAHRPAAEEVSQDLAYAHVKALAQDIGSRPADSESYRRAAEYARAELERLGYEVEVEPFSYPYAADRSRVVAGAEGASAIKMRQSDDAEVTGQLVEVGLAREGDLSGKDLKGKIALAKRGEITFSSKAENVRAAGAVGLVVYNNTRGPFRGELSSKPGVPVVGVSAADGDRLLALAGGEVTLRAQVENQERHSSNVVAYGGAERAGRVLVGGHLDSVAEGPGANDNASGSAAVLELARVFATRPEKGQLAFALFGGEEDGLWGSRRHVERLGSDARAIRAMVNLDMVAVGDRFELGATGERSRDLIRRLTESAGQLGYRVGQFEAGQSSDHGPFMAAGIPAVMIHWRDDPNYHQPTDTADRIDPEKLAMSTRLVARTLEGLLAAS